MRRRGGNQTTPGDDASPSGRAFRLALALGLIAPAAARAGDQGPELSAPAGLPAAAPLPELPAITPAAPPASRGPVLALPGISTPLRPASPATPPPADALMLPELDAPLGMSNAPPAARSVEPTIVESVPFEPAAPIEGRPPAGRASAARSGSAPPPSSSTTRSAGKPVAIPPPAARRPWWLGNPRPGTAAAAPAPGPATAGGSRAETAEMKSDPAADTLLRRKIERQARALVGNRARSLEVRVVGKQVAIEARGVGLFQKRGVRRALETMPALSGLRSSVAVLD